MGALQQCLIDILLLFYHAQSQLNITIMDSLQCDDLVTATISDQTHYYELIIESDRSVSFDTCSSATDVTVAVADDTGSDISHTYCNYAGDDCGTCSNGASYAEHFTIPLYPALYYIEIAPWNTGGVYTLSIARLSIIRTPQNKL
eukprot:236940_1